MSSGILLLLDDVIALTQNVSIYSSKIASSSVLTFKKVSGVVIDDIAVTPNIYRRYHLLVKYQ